MDAAHYDVVGQHGTLQGREDLRQYKVHLCTNKLKDADDDIPVIMLRPKLSSVSGAWVAKIQGLNHEYHTGPARHYRCTDNR